MNAAMDAWLNGPGIGSGELWHKRDGPSLYAGPGMIDGYEDKYVYGPVITFLYQ